MASTPRTFDRQSQEWRDGDALFLRCSVWREQAENVAESLSKGSRVVVIGRLKQRSFETKDGEKRTVVELDADEVAPSLRYAQAQVRRTTRGQGGSGTASPSARGGPSDPWATAGAGASGYAESEPPFAHTTGYDLAVHRGEVVV